MKTFILKHPNSTHSKTIKNDEGKFVYHTTSNEPNIVNKIVNARCESDYKILEGELKPGCKIKFTKKRPKGWNTHGAMDHFLGSTHTVTWVRGKSFNIEGNDIWAFRLTDIKKIIE